MTVRVERTFELPVPVEAVWEFIADPAQRARAISVVKDYDLEDEDGTVATWYVSLPIPILDRTTRVRTEDVRRTAPEYVKFVGRSRALRVTGEHRLEPTQNGSRLTNTFVVDGRLPGVERYFKKNLDGELRNLERAILDSVTE